MDDCDARLSEARRIIAHLYEEPFTPETLEELTPRILRVVGARYFSFYLDGPFRTVVSNNPEGYRDVYTSVVQLDHMKQTMIESGREFILNEHPEALTAREHREFNGICQKARLITDHIYSPVLLRSCYRGFWAIAKSDRSDPHYHDVELSLARFLVQFLNDALERSLLPPAVAADTAYLSAHGDVLEAGEEILPAIRDAKRSQGWERLLQAYRSFVSGPKRVGFDRASLEVGDSTLTFHFALLRTGDLRLKSRDLPYAQVRLFHPARHRLPELDFSVVADAYELTARELEVVRCIFQGKSNKQIAYELKIEESTVKRHTHNIYGKTRLATRTELVLGLSKSIPVGA